MFRIINKKILFIFLVLIVSNVFSAFANAETNSNNLNVTLTIPSQGGNGNNPPPPPPPADNLPTISNVATSTTQTTAKVTWNASDDKGISTSSFNYGTTLGYGLSATVNGSYEVNISGLATNTLYYFKISVVDTGNHTVISTGYFITSAVVIVPPPPVPPVISNLQVEVGSTTTSLKWQTDKLSDSQVNYGLTNAYGSTAVDSNLTLTHNLLLVNLLPNTTYNYKVISTDSNALSTATANATFVTKKDTVPPPNVSNLALAVNQNSLLLTWINPSLIAAPDFAGVKLVRKIGEPSQNQADGLVLFTGNNQSFNDNTIVPSTTYFYTVFAFDTSLNYSSGAFTSGLLNLPPPPPPPASENCANGVDDNANGLIDCNDPACVNYEICKPKVPGGNAEVCNNGIDDDSNGLIDCADAACLNSQACIKIGQVISTEICNNGIDDDTNGLVDCADQVCANNSVCKKNDNYKSPSTTIPAFERINESSVYFLGANRRVILQPINKRVTSLVGFNTAVVVPKRDLTGPPTFVKFVLDGRENYQLVYENKNDFYIADFSFPVAGQHTGNLEINYGSGQFDSLAIPMESLPLGSVTDGEKPLAGVTIKLLKDDKDYDVQLDHKNPFVTGIDGSYGWVLPNGHYTLEATKNGYYNRTQNVVVDNHFINIPIVMIPTPPPLLVGISPTSTLTKNISQITKNVGKNIVAISQVVQQTAVDTAKQANELRKDPEVQETVATRVVPSVVTAAAVGTVTAVSWVNLLPLLRLLFLEPLLLLGFRRRSKWGQVYHALSKLPIDLATIRLINTETNKVVQTKVTDKQGRYAFIVNPGRYRLVITKNSFIFPSKLLAGFKEDGRRVNIYHGEIITVDEKNAVIAANIPLDPIGEAKKPRRIFWMRAGRLMQSVLSWAGLIITALSIFITPRWYIVALLALHIFIFVIFRRLAMPPKIKSWGIVYDEHTRRPIGKAVARLFSSQFNKLVSTQITDSRGRYYFMAGDNQYYVTYDHAKYSESKSDIIDLKGKELDTIAVDIGLKAADKQF